MFSGIPSPSFREAHLEDANLGGAHLDANLSRAHLERANLGKVVGLTQAPWDITYGDDRTVLPDGTATR